jgi:hypothetical protein
MRAALQVIIPLILPTLLFLAYAWYMRRRAIMNGHAEPPPWTQGPWGWLIILGAALSALSLIALALFGDDPARRGAYVPAKVIDGELVPGHIDPAAAPPSR